MTGTSYQLAEKISEVCDELKRISLWKTGIPDWVNNYNKAVETEVDFCEWLQFIYLPNLLQQTQHHEILTRDQNLAPQAVKFFGDEMRRGKMLQLLVELDSLV